MKPLKTLAFALSCVVALSTSVRADMISLYRDEASGICAAPTQAFVPLTVYVIHSSLGGSTGSAWRVDNTSTMIAVSSDCGTLSFTGDPFTGISLAYGSCMTGSFLICQLTYLNTTADAIPGCNQLNVMPYPAQLTVMTIDCDQDAHAAGGGFFSFDPLTDWCWDCAGATETSTWGAVKALYR